MKKDKFSASGLEIELEVGLSEVVTAHAGAALLVEAVRRSGVIAGTDRVLPAKRNCVREVLPSARPEPPRQVGKSPPLLSAAKIPARGPAR